MSKQAIALFEDQPPTLDEAQAAVGGYVTLVNLPNGDQMLVDEEGSLKLLAINEEATFHAGQLIVGPVAILRGTARWLPENAEADDE